MICCRCSGEMFTVTLTNVEKLTEDLVFKHLEQHSECGTCGVVLHVYIPALTTTRILRLKGKKK